MIQDLEKLILIKNLAIGYSIFSYFILIGIRTYYKKLLKQGKIQQLALNMPVSICHMLIITIGIVSLLMTENTLKDSATIILFSVLFIGIGIPMIGIQISDILDSKKRTKDIIINNGIVSFFNSLKIPNRVRYNDIFVSLPKIRIKANPNGKYFFDMEFYGEPDKSYELTEEEIKNYFNKLQNSLFTVSEFEKKISDLNKEKISYSVHSTDEFKFITVTNTQYQYDSNGNFKKLGNLTRVTK